MEETTYQKLADEAYRRVADAFEDVDPDVVDCEVAGDVLTLTMKGGKRCVLNTQRPTRQLWLAANARAWHFSFDDAKREWRDDKGQGHELYATLARIVKEQAGVDVAFA
jgi:CyaY protein